MVQKFRSSSNSVQPFLRALPEGIDSLNINAATDCSSASRGLWQGISGESMLNKAEGNRAIVVFAQSAQSHT